jgi:hypothetical protein
MYHGVDLFDLGGEFSIRRRNSHLRQVCRKGGKGLTIPECSWYWWQRTCRSGLDLRHERFDRWFWEGTQCVLIRDE